MLRLFRVFFVFLSWALPLGLMAVGWFVFPPLREPVSFDAPPRWKFIKGCSF